MKPRFLSGRTMCTAIAAMFVAATAVTAFAPAAEAHRRHYRSYGYYYAAPRYAYYPRYDYYPRYYYSGYGYYDPYYSYRRKRRNNAAKYIAAGVGLAILGAALSHRRRW